MNYSLNILGGVLSTLISIAMSVSASANFGPTSSYEHLELEGWVVRVSNDYSNHPQKRKLILNEAKQQLKAINTTVPQSALSKLKKRYFGLSTRVDLRKARPTTLLKIGLSKMVITRIRRVV